MFDFANLLEIVRGEPANCRVKFYGEEVAEVCVCNRAIFSDGLELNEPKKRRKLPKAETAAPEPDGEAARRSRRRAIKAVYDKIACTPELNLFVTLTLDKEKIDRYSYDTVIKALNVWLDNRVRRKGLRYILIPEYHKDGAIHFHGLWNDVLPRSDSGKQTKRGQTIYNLPDWGYGFSTAVVIEGVREHVLKYITKYITKDSEKVGGRYYLSGGKFGAPTYKYFSVDYELVDAPEVVVDGINRRFKYL